jgi:hypothetical protein
MYRIFEDKNVKRVISENYNYKFDKNTGDFYRWGKTVDDDPVFSPYGNEILDIEITDICNGVGSEGPCKFCYKSNTDRNKTNMSFETFKEVFHKFNRNLNQIAFGVDAKGTSNPDMLKIMHYTRENGVIPNVTIADIDDEMAKELSNVCGAVAVSRYSNKNYCYDSIQRLYKNGLNQINIHILVSNETLDQIYETFNDYLNGEERLKGLNAIVLLSLKKKGRGKSFTSLNQEKFSKMVNFALKNNIPIGFDSCGAHKLMKSLNKEDLSKIEPYIEPCESFGMFSAYINCKGEYFPCSFAEGEGEWKNGINMLKIDNFLKDVWFSNKLNKWRKISIDNNRNCPLFEV